MRPAALILIFATIFLCSCARDSNELRLASPKVFIIPPIGIDYYPDVHVNGAIKISISDKNKIIDSTNKLTLDQVLWIDVIDSNTVDVVTGKIRGPLDGGGKIYRFQKLKGDWQLLDDGAMRIWTS